MGHVTVAVPATTANLGPGFDSLGAAVSRHLVVRSIPRDALRVSAAGDDAAELPTGDDNLIWRAVEAFCARFDADVPDVSLRTTSDIPLERGLGSSSAAIVAGLAVARALTGTPVTARQVVELADELEGHPDNVAPAVLGGLVAATRGDDGRLVLRLHPPHTRLRPVAYVPEARQSTTAARGVLPETLARAEVATQAGRAAHVVGALVGAWPADPAAAGDRLHEPPRLEVMATSGEQLARLRSAGVHAWLSGAGPSLMAAVPAGSQPPPAVAGFRRLDLGWDLRGTVTCRDDGCAVAAPPTAAGAGDGGGRHTADPALGCVHCPRRGV